ncbi:hypothetical protein C8J57DRAFT_1225195 [Mycena rebaudengoi]|nr:hypothetical protein C8J57DRAFT_1225195 [Mycena rebaudengoi]
MADSNLPGYKLLRFGSAGADPLPEMAIHILHTIQALYHEHAADERKPTALDWEHSAILSYHVDPVTINFLAIEGDNSPMVLIPQPRFKLVVTFDQDRKPRYFLEDYSCASIKITAKIRTSFQPICTWVHSDIASRELLLPAAVAARNTARAEDMQRRLEEFYTRVGERPFEMSEYLRNNPSCPSREFHASEQRLYTCASCRIFCCLEPNCPLAAVDGAKGCMAHLQTIYCRRCSEREKPKLPDLFTCSECQKTHCDREIGSWCIGRSGRPRSPVDITGPDAAHIHAPKPFCNLCSSGYIECCAERCWSKNSNGALSDMVSRRICKDCFKKWEGDFCIAKHQWVCPRCLSDPSSASSVECISSRQGSTIVCAGCEEQDDKDDSDEEVARESGSAGFATLGLNISLCYALLILSEN